MGGGDIHRIIPQLLETLSLQPGSTSPGAR